MYLISFHLNYLIFSINFLLFFNTVYSDVKDYLKKDYSLVKPYNDARWDTVGSTIITNNYIRLTPDHQSRKGALWNSVPCTLKNWELHIHFKVSGMGNEIYGDGMAIWYAKERLKIGPVFGNQDFFSGLVVFLDTYVNMNEKHTHEHPYISAMVNNGSLHYDHDRDGTHTELAGCASHFRGINKESYLAIRYENRKITVSTDIDGTNAWKTCFSVDGVWLPTGYYFGVSAATGELSDNHDIISFKVYDIGEPKEIENLDYSSIEPMAEHFIAHREHIASDKVESGSSWWTFILYSLLFLALTSIACYTVYFIYGKKQERKRLY